MVQRRKEIVSSESNFSFTTKINGQDLFTVRGDDYDMFLKNIALAGSVPAISHLINLLDGSAPITEQAINTIQSVFPGSTVITPAPVAATANNVVAPSLGGGKTCAHGRMTAKQGTGNDGKTWRGYMCPAPQGATDKCKNAYIYPNMPEWHTFVVG
jgi:hypothetical protein